MPWIVRDAPFDWTLREAARRREAVEETLARVTSRLAEEGIDYVLIGGMALVAHGYVRFTNDVHLLTTPEGLVRIHERLIGRGYRPAFEGSRKKLRDTETGIDVELITAGEYPGDGKPKPVRFPVPKDVAVDRGGVKVISLAKLIELKLASGLSAEHRRLRDLADVQDLIIALKLPRELREDIDPSVRDEYDRMWDSAQEAPER
jgi:hypothetical protein